MKKLLFISIFFILLTKVTYAEYSLSCVTEAQFKFFDKEKWETNIRPVTLVIKDKTLEYFSKINPKPSILTIIEQDKNTIVGIRTIKFKDKIAINILSFDKIEKRMTMMAVNDLGLTVYSGICN
jgi:hypothetical protein